MDILSRSQWGAELELFVAMPLPARGIHVHHSVTIVDDDGTYTATDDVAADMAEIERIGGQRFGRFPYSWCLHPSGWIGEGGGLTIGAHTADHNSTSFGLCLIGNYEVAEPTGPQIEAFRQLRRALVDAGYLAAGHYVEPHRARKATACPGARTMARWADLLAPPQETDMTPQERQWLEGELRTIRTKVETTFNQVNLRTGALSNKIDALTTTVLGQPGADVDEDALAASLAALVPDSIATKVVDELHRRTGPPTS